MFCLHGTTICPQAQIVHTKANSVIRCHGIEIPILPLHCTPDGVPRATAPKWCPLRNEPVRETVRRIIEDPSVAARWGPRKRSEKRCLLDAQVIDILKRAAKGEKHIHIADIYGISKQVVSGICTGRNYKDVYERFRWDE